ncbi:hypothetical protein DM860_011386 [Cuscuta australis]|uniref:DUF4005 domain-containing protein n=1 Tax=Cuscuta australis TaxID=267555 RepID=A0A328DST9_9ASTE|nr:hypothetical protein DM860_011386 [Cuscuta australis]
MEMGVKKGGSSWLSAVKRALRSPIKEKRNHHHHHHPLEEDEDKKRERRRWLFRKSTNSSNSIIRHESGSAVQSKQAAGGRCGGGAAEERHHRVIAVAVAEAAVATAQAAVEVARLAKAPPPPAAAAASNVLSSSSSTDARGRKHLSALIIQTYFRGYLARRALRALRGLVKLQALVRGHNVRKQAKTTLRCMQALVRVQSRILLHRTINGRHQQVAAAGCKTSSTTTPAYSLPHHHHSRHHDDFYSPDRMSTSRCRGGSGYTVAVEDWDERSHTIEEVKAMLYSRKEMQAVASLRRPQRDLSHAFSQQMWRGGNNNPSSIDTEDESRERQQWQYSHHYPSPPTKLISPQSSREERRANCLDGRGSATMPSYMATTESAKARTRSQSAPRHRAPSKVLENAGPAKKRLLYPIPDPDAGTGYCLRSPSFKSVASGYEHHSNYSSPLYTESVGGAISSRDLRRWWR